jgi:3-methyladenine DNA glycosylase AlkD
LIVEGLAEFVQAELSAAADPALAPRMAAYLKTEMPFYGVQKSGRTAVWREVKRRFPVVDNDSYQRAVVSLWELPHREEKYLAITTARNYRQFITNDNMPLYRRLIVEGAWWDLVDDVAINCVGAVLRTERAAARATLEKWIDDEFIWLRRSSIIAHIKHKEETDEQTLFDHCLRRAHEKEFFIRKAIGWALRSYARTAPEAVTAFLLANRSRWSGLTFREAAKHLDL